MSLNDVYPPLICPIFWALFFCTKCLHAEDMRSINHRNPPKRRTRKGLRLLEQTSKQTTNKDQVFTLRHIYNVVFCNTSLIVLLEAFPINTIRTVWIFYLINLLLSTTKSCHAISNPVHKSRYWNHLQMLATV